ncbi:MAG: extracellular solute-binding protein [Fimbriimonas ginsengisoli]|uniref:Extracellular solute-binding protein n=1 Tax=Fimbriimonas ginsengisoli TaxID=1005039 RepID=A0A931PUW1_FIMGI|nr:extracellular solute-binding protein [Fimbriimonas ginsengisoli]
MRLLALIPLVLCAWLVGGCGSEPKQVYTRRVVTVWGVAGEEKGFYAAVRAFEHSHPNLRVRVLSMGTGGMSPQKLLTSIVGRVPPDVIYQDRFTVSDWASRGAFRSLDDLVARDRRDPLSPKAEQYYPAAWNEAMYGGKVYAIPLRVDDRALYWNRAVFRENAATLRQAGLDPERAPRTWSELLAYGKALTKFDASGNPVRLGFIPNLGNSWLYLYAFQSNAAFLSADGRRCTLDSPETEAALRFMKDGYDIVGGYEKAQAFQTADLGGEQDAFMTGRVAMKIDGNWTLGSIVLYGPRTDFQVAPAPVPDDRYFGRGRFAGEKDRFVTWSGGFSWAIPTGARHVDDGWEFIKWITSVEGRLYQDEENAKWQRLQGRAFIPRMHANVEANEKAFRLFKPADPKFADALRVHMDLMAHSRTRPPTFAGQLLWDEHARAVENACSNRMGVKEALLAGQRVVQRELDDSFTIERYPEMNPWIPWVTFGAILVCFKLSLYRRWRRMRLGRNARQEARWAYAFITPWLVGFGALTLGPMLASLTFSFTRYSVLSPPRWVGLSNYADLATSDRDHMLKALSNVAYLGGLGVPLGIATGLGVALLLNAGVRGLRFYRTCFYLPSIVPAVASAVLWWWVLAPDPHRGLVNAAWTATISRWLHLEAPGWLSAEAWAKPALIAMGLWGAGSGMILWLAGLKGIPTSLYEAASLDGAKPAQSFWKITVPQLTPIIFFSAVMGVIGSLQEFDRAYVLTTGLGFGPGDSLLTPVYYLFSHGFGYFRMGYASAIAWITFVIILLLTLLQFRLAPGWVRSEEERE